MPVPLAEFARDGQDSLLKLSSGRCAMFLEQMQEAYFAEFFFAGIASLRHAIRKENEPVTGYQPCGPCCKLLFGKNAEHSAAGLQPLMRSIAVQKDRGIVSRVCVLQHACRPVELRIKKSNETVVAGVVANERIQPRTQPIRRHG